jgi:DNA polymerase/3'-5' exonuclease PolX
VIDLFGQAMVYFSPLEELLTDLLCMDGVGLTLDQKVRRNGQKYKRLVFRGEVVELFIADADNYGNILTIRTGDAEFSHALVTPRRAGGLMPGHLAQHGGYLWRGAEKIACPTEEDFFQALGIQWIEPKFRNAANARNLARHVEKPA